MIKYLLFPIYLLQLENYNLKRFWRGSNIYAIRRPKVWRQKIVWTNKLKLIFVTAIILIMLLSLIAASLTSFGFGLIFMLICISEPFPFLVCAVIFILPLELTIKKWLLTQAKNKLARHQNLIVIGIAGSYGKTTMKEMITSVLKQKYNVLATPETINTPIGIARLITKRLALTTEVLIIEMGEFWQGDVKELCELVHPNIGIITGINEAHLERLGNLNTTIGTIFELAKYSKQDGLLILNADDANIVGHYKRYVGNHKTVFYSSNNAELSQYKASDVIFDEIGQGQSFTVQTAQGTPVQVQTKLLGHYVIGVSLAIIILAKELELSDSEIQKGLESLHPIPHRLQPIWNKDNNVLVIDDSFNGNPDGVREAIAVLAKFKNRRKIVLTPGLVETGNKTEDIHKAIGKELATVADKVLLIQNSVSKYIIDGLKANGFNDENITIFPTAQAAHASLGKVLQPNDVILFQNDWPDNYS